MVEVDFVAVSGIVGFVMPLVISAFKQQSWSPQLKKAFAFTLALVAAVVSTGVQQGWTGLTWDNLIASAAVIMPMAQTSYTGFWQDSAPEAKLAAAFDRTSV